MSAKYCGRSLHSRAWYQNDNEMFIHFRPQILCDGKWYNTCCSTHIRCWKLHNVKVKHQILYGTVTLQKRLRNIVRQHRRNIRSKPCGMLSGNNIMFHNILVLLFVCLHDYHWQNVLHVLIRTIAKIDLPKRYVLVPYFAGPKSCRNCRFITHNIAIIMKIQSIQSMYMLVVGFFSCSLENGNWYW